MAENLTDDELRERLGLPKGPQTMTDTELMSAIGPQGLDPATLPELHKSGLLAGEDPVKVAALTPTLLTTQNNDELADIITTQFPNVGKVFAPPEQEGGQPRMMLVNNNTGAASQINIPGLSSFDILQTAATASAFFPASRSATLLGGAGKALLTETALQANQAALGGEFNPEEVAVATALGPLAREAPAVPDVSPVQVGQSLVQAGDDAGIRVLTTDAVPPRTFAGRTLSETAEKIPLAGTSSLRQSQQAQRIAAVDDVIERYAGSNPAAIVGSLKQKSSAIKRAAGNVLENVENQLSALGDVPHPKTRAAIAEAQQALTDPRVIGSSKAMGDLQVLVDALDNPQTFQTLRMNRTAMRDLANGLDSADRSQLPTNAKRLIERVMSAMKQDMDDFARPRLSKREFGKWQRANSIWADEADKLRRSRLKSVLDKGDLVPETVGRMLFSRNQSELRQLNNALTERGRRHARSAIISRIADITDRQVSGTTPNSFARELRKHRAQIEVFFSGDERKALEGLSRVLDATRRAQDAPITTPTGQTLLAVAGVGGAIADLGATIAAAGTLGGLARLYESPAVRNALLRAGSARAGTSRFRAAVGDAQQAIVAAVQAAAPESPDVTPDTADISQ